MPAKVGNRGPETILVVEDYAQLREFSSGVLRELGYEVIETSCGRTALEVLAHPGMNLISKPFTYQELAAKVRALLDPIGRSVAHSNPDVGGKQGSS